MRMTGAQVEDLLKEIIEEDANYQRLLIIDRLNARIDSDPDLIERLIEKAWDEVFGFDEDRALSEKMDFDHLAFHQVKDRLLRAVEEGIDIKPLVQRLGLNQKVFSIPEVHNLINPADIDIKEWIREYTPWRHKLHHIVVVQMLLDIYAERYQNPQAYPPPMAMIKKGKDETATYVFLEDIPDTVRPKAWESKLNRSGFKKKPFESYESVLWPKLDKIFGYNDKDGQRLFLAYSYLQNIFDHNHLGDVVVDSYKEFRDIDKPKDRGLYYFIKIAEELPLTKKGMARLQDMREIVAIKKKV